MTSPEDIYLLRSDSEITAMASYNRRVFSGFPSLIVEGIAVTPKMQGKEVFKAMTDNAINGEAVICLRTQSPRMYRALEKYCASTYPCQNEIPEAVKAIRSDFARHLLCSPDELGIIRGYYGELFYGEEPKHKGVSNFFRTCGINLNNGDALLAIGIR